MVYVKGYKFCIFLHTLVQFQCIQVSKIDKTLLIAGNGLNFGLENFVHPGGTGFRVFQLEMLEIPVFLLFSTMYKGLVKCTVENAQNSDF